MKRCGNVAASLATLYTQSQNLLFLLSTVDVRSPKTVYKSLQNYLCGVGQALNRWKTLALAWYQCWAEPLLAVPGGLRKHRGLSVPPKLGPVL